MMKSHRKRIFLTWALLFSALSAPLPLKAAAEAVLSADQLFAYLQNGRHEKLDTFSWGSLPSSGNITVKGQQISVSQFQQKICEDLMKKNDFYRAALMLKRLHITVKWSNFLAMFLEHINAKKSLNLSTLRALAEIPWDQVSDTKGSRWHPYIPQCRSSSRYTSQDEASYSCQNACFRVKDTKKAIYAPSLECLWQSLLTLDLSITKKVYKMSRSSSGFRRRSDYDRGSSYQVEEIEDRKMLKEVKKRLLENANSLNTALLENIIEKEKDMKEQRQERQESDSGRGRGRRLAAPDIPSHSYSSRGGDGYSSRGSGSVYSGSSWIYSDPLQKEEPTPVPKKVVRSGRAPTSVRTVATPSPVNKT